MSNEIVKLQDDRRAYKVYRDMLNEWTKEAREAGKAICNPCAKWDWDSGEIKENWKAYSRLKQVSKVVKVITGRGPYKMVEYRIDYVCPNEHGVSIVFDDEEYETFVESKTSKEKDKNKK